MGTDIHSIAQVRKPASRFNQLDIHEQPPTLPDVWQTVAIGIAGDDRSYNTFAMLADVRNGVGFAGVKTSDGFPVIHEPRGLPADLELDGDDHPVKRGSLVAAWDWNGELAEIDDKEARRVAYLEEGSMMWLGDHSHSWCTLMELKNFISNTASKHEVRIHGIVALTEFRAAKLENRGYKSWCGGVFGRDVVVVNETEAETQENATHVQTSWVKNALEVSHLNRIAAALEVVAQRCGVTDDNVRFVYGFDS
jgi:hypothetical protein